MDGVIHVHIVDVTRVMPVVVARRHQNVFQPAEIDAQVGVRQHRLNADQNDVGVDGRRRESQDHQRQQHRGAGQHHFDQMHARPCQPVHVPAGMMHRMKTPQQRHLMIDTMQPGLEQIGEEHRKDELQPDRQ